jgi:carbohydrate-selective porin OprB
MTRRLAAAAAAACLAAPLAAQQATLPPGPVVLTSGEILTGTAGTLTGERVPIPADARMQGFEKWWNGKSLASGTINPVFEARDALGEKGLILEANYRGAFFGVLSAQGGPMASWLDQIDLGARIKPGEIPGLERLGALQAFVAFRYRDQAAQMNPNNAVQAESMFNPTNWAVGRQFRLLSFGFEAGTRALLPVEDMLVLRGGWLQPQREFIDQPLSKMFLNTAITSNKGIGGNIPFGSSFSTWGGTLKLSLPADLYIKNGLFMSFPNASASSNHGFSFRGNAADPSLNGLFYMGEAGATPKFGEQKLEGRFAFGAYFYGTPGGQTTTWSGNTAPGQYGFYFQADQRLTRESGGDAAKPPREGLSVFNLLTLSPGNAVENTFPLYFQSGLAYEGAIPGRDKDLAIAAIAYGVYERNSKPARDYTAVVELGYRAQLGGWTYIQPYFQYLVRPNGTSQVANAAVIGFQTGVVF